MENIDNFLDASTLNISKYESSFGNAVQLSNSDLASLLHLDRGFVEYVMAAVFPHLKTREQFGPIYAEHINEKEARAILYAARENLINSAELENVRGRHVVFRDDNPYLAGANQYGKLIMELANNGEIQYIDKEEALYDIYAAGTALKALYLKHIGPSVGAYLNNPAFQSCENYYGIYAAVKTMDPTLKFDILPKDRFISEYRSNPTLQWVSDEFQSDYHQENIGFLQRVYLSIDAEIKEKYRVKAMIDNFKHFVSEVVATFPPEYREIYKPQMESMFSGDTRLMMQYAQRYAAIHGRNSSNLSDSLLREIVNVDFVPDKIVIENKAAVIYLTRDTSIPHLKFLGFDSHIGSTAFRNMLGDIGVMATSSNYHALRLQYSVASRGHFRNMFSGIVLAAIAPIKNRQEFKGRKIEFTDDAVFLGGGDNFVGKAIEIMVNTKPDIYYHPSSPYGIPDYQPTSPQPYVSPIVEEPYYYNPQSPSGFRAQKANIMLRMGRGDKFERSMNVDYIDKPREYFSISAPTGLDPQISHWVQTQFDMFITFYVYLHTQFVAPARFDLETFYRDVYGNFINKLDAAGTKALSDSFNPNNEISKIFVELIVSNFSVLLTNGTLDSTKFFDFQKKGISELQKLQPLTNPNSILFERLSLCEQHVANKLSPYFNAADISADNYFSETFMILVFSKFHFQMPVRRKLGSQFYLDGDEEHDTTQYTPHEHNLINFWWSVK